nr:hypothetical protein [Tanacetum cinerariifolium]
MEGNEESDAIKFFDDILNNKEDPDTRIEPKSHKERPEAEKSTDCMTIDEEVEEESAEDALLRKKENDEAVHKERVTVCMRLEQYLTFNNHALWEVIVNGDLVSLVALAGADAKGLIPPKTAEQKLARKNELKPKSTLMLAILDKYLLKFHARKDAKSLYEAIKNRFGGNKESKKIQKTILKQNYENFVASSQEGLDKTYDSVSQMCDKKNSVLFTDTKCVVISPDFKLLDESQVLLKVPRNNNMYSFDLWHRRLGHINFKTLKKLVRGNLVRGFPSKLFENDHTCVACQKGKQHKASCKTKIMSSICKPSQGDTGTKFKNRIMNEFCKMKGIRREFSVARTPQQNGVAERKNKTLIEAAKTMLADSKLLTTFWAEAVNTACSV